MSPQDQYHWLLQHNYHHRLQQDHYHWLLHYNAIIITGYITTGLLSQVTLQHNYHHRLHYNRIIITDYNTIIITGYVTTGLLSHITTQLSSTPKGVNQRSKDVTKTQQQGPELPNVTLDLANEKTQGKRYTPPELHPQGFGGAYESCIYPHARWELLRAIRVFAVVYV